MGRVSPRNRPRVKDGPSLDQDTTGVVTNGVDAGAELVVLAAPVPRTAERVAARFGDLVEAPVVVTQGAQLPLAGLLLALPALEMTGLLEVPRRRSRR